MSSLAEHLRLYPNKKESNLRSRPTYELGIWSMIVSHLIEAVLISVLGLLLRWENQKRDRLQSQMEGGLEGRDLDATAFLDLTDRENMKYASPRLFPFFGVLLTLPSIASDTSIRRRSLFTLTTHKFYCSSHSLNEALSYMK